jgi:hypothetical protein
MIANGFLGYDRFVWFQGVVEDRFDPLKLGRVRVRILGLHTEDKTKIPTEDLPWAFPILPITSASMNGIGDTPVGPVEGTWVVGFFRDGDNCQEPVVFGTIGGIPQERTRPNIGFSDPFNHYPEDDYIGESDTNRLARAEKIEETVIEIRKNSLANEGKPIKVALEEVSNDGKPRPKGQDTAWLEPNPPYKAKYPFNKVFQTERGIVKEWDDTKDHRRIHEYHPCGTFYEVYEEEGKAHKITKINGTNYTIILDDDNIFVRGSVNITAEGRVNVYSGNDINVEANEKLTIHAKKNTTIFCEENISLTAKKDINLTSGGSITLNCAESMNTTVEKNFTTTTKEGNISLVSNRSMGLSSVLNMNITSQTNCYLYSSVKSNISSGIKTVIDSSINTTVQSDISTSVGSKLETKIIAGGSLDLTSLTNIINLKSFKRINLESPIVTRKFPKENPLPPIKLTFDP